ncbi:hypothetical protein C8Q79DRAFT_735256 [Trametes meyenii]|nr:hypothetical protein C8Q79DRAFT_735256 [Trametes meyenii]
MLGTHLFVSAAAVVSFFDAARGTTQAASGTLPTLTAVPSGITACSENCIAQAALANGCSDVGDLQCICTNAQFLNSARDCLLKQCPIQDGEAALKDFQQLCGEPASSAPATASTIQPSSDSGSTSSHSSGHSSTPTSSTHSKKASETGSASKETGHPSGSVTSLPIPSTTSVPISTGSTGSANATSPATSTATAPSSTLTVLPTSTTEASSTAIDTETSLPPSNTDGSTSAAASQTTNAATALSPVLGAMGSDFVGLFGVGIAVMGVALGTGFVF